MRVPPRNSSEPPRTIIQIAPEELQAAILLVVQHSVGIGVQSLLSETAKVFGFNRTGDKIKDVLLEQLQSLEASGQVNIHEDVVSF